MAKTYTAQSVSGNHDVDYRVNEAGEITAMVVQSIVVYGYSEYDELHKKEEVDVWPMLNESQKTTIQRQYERLVSLFDSQFLS